MKQENRSPTYLQMSTSLKENLVKLSRIKHATMVHCIEEAVSQYLTREIAKFNYHKTVIGALNQVNFPSEKV